MAQTFSYISAVLLLILGSFVLIADLFVYMAEFVSKKASRVTMSAGIGQGVGTSSCLEPAPLTVVPVYLILPWGFLGGTTLVLRGTKSSLTSRRHCKDAFNECKKWHLRRAHGKIKEILAYTQNIFVSVHHRYFFV